MATEKDVQNTPDAAAEREKPRLDLAVVIPFLAKYGGAERYLIECVNQWQRRHDITIYSTKINDQLLEEHGIGPAVKRRQIAPYFEGEHSLLLNAVLLPKIWQEEIGHHDLYHTHLWPTHLIDLHPMVWFPHEPLRILHDLRFEQEMVHTGEEAARNIHIYPKYNYDRIGDHLYEAYLSSIDSMDKSSKPEMIVANSRYTARYLEEVYGHPVKEVVYPGVKLELFMDLPVDQNLFVTISQLWSHKRVNLLIEAIQMTDDTQLVVIGSGPEKEKLLEQTKRLGVDNRVFFLSGLTNHELSLVLSRACAFLFAPIKEPFGIVVLEAMAAAKPVIAVNEGGYTEICDDGFAFIVPPFPSAFAEKISYLQANPDVARKMGLEGKERVPQYTWQRGADKLEQLLIRTYRDHNKKPRREDVISGEGALFGVQYYLWYEEGYGNAHWNDSVESGYVNDKPIMGYYGSIKGSTIEYHMDLFEEMTLDYVALNLHIDENGANGIELMAIQHVFDIAKKRKSKLKFAIQICPYIHSDEEVVRVVEMVRSLFMDHPNYFAVDGAPVLFWFWSSHLDGNKKFIIRLKTACKGLCNMAFSLRLAKETNETRLTFRFFDAFGLFSPLELSKEKNWNKVWSMAYRASDKAGMKYRVVTMSPGYDDRGLEAKNREGNPYRYIPRDNGRVLQECARFVEGLSNPPDLVMISTFNEFHENTHIEPTMRYGKTYVEYTKRIIRRIRKTRKAQ